MKTLIIVTHANIETSVINKRWVNELQKYPEKYTVRIVQGLPGWKHRRGNRTKIG